MSRRPLRPTPRLRDVVLEQVRAVGLTLRKPAAVAGALLGLATMFLAAEIFRGSEIVDFHPEHWILPGVAGLLLPIGVWKGEARFGPGFLWTLPVERRRHALARVFAGWIWLIGGVALFVLWLLGLALVSGGNVLGEETLRLVPSSFSPAPGVPVDPDTVESVPWTPRPVLWLVPFTAATGTYLLGSGMALGLRHPLRWIVGTALGLFLLTALVSEVGLATDRRWLALAPSRLLRSLLFGPYGLDALLSARTEHLKVEATLPTGERTVLWRGLPDLRQWATATLLWTGAGVAALWTAASRHREHRRD